MWNWILHPLRRRKDQLVNVSRCLGNSAHRRDSINAKDDSPANICLSVGKLSPAPLDIASVSFKRVCFPMSLQSRFITMQNDSLFTAVFDWQISLFNAKNKWYPISVWKQPAYLSIYLSEWSVFIRINLFLVLILPVRQDQYEVDPFYSVLKYLL